jgi:hypothetical protein
MPIGAKITRGLAAGAIGTSAMTAWQELAAQLRSSGETQEQPSDPWESAPVPAKVAKKIGEELFGVEVPAERIPLLTNVMHWSYGTGWGAVYGLASGSARRRRALRRGALFGTFVWAASYAQLVPLGLYSPPWKYPPGELALDLSYHVVYGIGAGLGFKLVAPM